MASSRLVRNVLICLAGSALFCPAEEEPTVREAIFASYDFAKVPPGTWVRFSSGGVQYTISVVKKTEDETWVESDIFLSVGFKGTMIQYHLDAGTGEVRRAFWRRADGTIAKLAVRREPTPRKDADDRAVGKNEASTVEFDGKVIPCRLLEVTWTVADIVVTNRYWVIDDGPLPRKIEALERPISDRMVVDWDVKPERSGTIVKSEKVVESGLGKMTDETRIIGHGDKAEPTIAADGK